MEVNITNMFGAKKFLLYENYEISPDITLTNSRVWIEQAVQYTSRLKPTLQTAKHEKHLHPTSPLSRRVYQPCTKKSGQTEHARKRPQMGHR